jgi:hypothetical protein
MIIRTAMIAAAYYTAHLFGIGDSIDDEFMSLVVELIKNGQ